MIFPLGGVNRDRNSGLQVANISLNELLSLRSVGESLALKPSKIRSQMAGPYVSPIKGRGMEFEEARPYQAGDDVRSLDWRVTARTGRPHTKVFREERERAVLLCLDLRRSMFFATRGCFKVVAAARSAAMVAWAAASRNDRIGGLLFSGLEHREVRPGRGRRAVLNFLRQLEAHSAWQQQETKEDEQTVDINSTIARLRRVARPGSLVVVFSDFRGLNHEGVAHLGQIARHSEMLLGLISDPLERELPEGGWFRVSDGGNRVSFNATDSSLRTEYSQRFSRWRNTLQDLSRRYGMHLMELSTNQDVADSLRKYLHPSVWR